MASINIYLNQNYTKKDGTCAVYLFTYIKGTKLRFNTGVSVKPEQWDEKNKKVKGYSQQSKDNNLIIKKSVSLLNDIFVKYRLENKELTPNLLKREYKNPTGYVDFYDFLQKMIDEKNKHMSKGTVKVYYSLFNKLKAYQKDLMFADIDSDFLENFESYMRKKLNNKPNTVHKTLRTFRAFLDLAKQKKIITENPFDTKRMRRGQADRVFLIEEEVEDLMEKYRDQVFYPSEHKVLSYFLFSCFTGLRISDIRLLRYDHIINNTIIMQPYKTRGISKIVKIPLADPALEIIQNENHHLRIKGYVFNPYTDQATNRILKDIMVQCGIRKNITFHCARHTFATMYLRKTKDVAGLQKLLAHYSINDTMKYVHVMIDDVRENMKVFDQF